MNNSMIAIAFISFCVAMRKNSTVFTFTDKRFDCLTRRCIVDNQKHYCRTFLCYSWQRISIFLESSILSLNTRRIDHLIFEETSANDRGKYNGNRE